MSFHTFTLLEDRCTRLLVKNLGRCMPESIIREKPEPKSTAATKPAAGRPKKKAAASVKTAAAKPTTPNLVVPTQSPTSPLEDISDLLDRLPLQACMELTRRLLTSISSFPTAPAGPWAVWKTVILFVAVYGSTP